VARPARLEFEGAIYPVTGRGATAEIAVTVLLREFNFPRHKFP
jgi:hypothetical protein